MYDDELRDAIASDFWDLERSHVRIHHVVTRHPRSNDRIVCFTLAFKDVVRTGTVGRPPEEPHEHHGVARIDWAGRRKYIDARRWSAQAP
jgi:hypothetical protein